MREGTEAFAEVETEKVKRTEGRRVNKRAETDRKGNGVGRPATIVKAG